MENSIYISSFRSCPTRYSESQHRTLEFLAQVHQESSRLENENRPLGKLVLRYGVKDTAISRRGFECPDIYSPPDKRILYNVKEGQIAGADIQQRSLFFGRRAEEVFDFFYPLESEVSPEHLIHVTCTGYLSPSAPQLLASKRNWNFEITHAYHMGCYAALPSLRLAFGQTLRNKTVDIVHNEMCSLHMNPSLHTPEQLVVQTLFADGHIKYKVSKGASERCFKIRCFKEKIIPGTADEMTWMPAPFGMAMSLSREVPNRIAHHIRGFTMELLSDCQISLDTALKSAIFAIHPGGPKIIETVATSLELQEDQIDDSQAVLYERGNMSSATLPHIWERILNKSSAPAPGTPIISLAFGPGLTVFGSIFEFYP